MAPRRPNSGEISVRIKNLHRSYRLNERFLRKLVRRILEFCGPSGGLELELVFLDDDSIKALNKKYMHRDRPTDVLSFTLTADGFGPKGTVGVAYISIDRAMDYSGSSPNLAGPEIVLYIIHAILHIFGYDDRKARDRGAMRAAEKKILGYLWKREDLSKVLMQR